MKHCETVYFKAKKLQTCQIHDLAGLNVKTGRGSLRLGHGIPDESLVFHVEICSVDKWLQALQRLRSIQHDHAKVVDGGQWHVHNSGYDGLWYKIHASANINSIYFGVDAVFFYIL